MKAHIIMTILMLSMALSAAHAQDVVAQMNEIKLNNAYVYGEATHENPETAYEEALEDMKISLKARLKREVEAKEIKSKVKKLTRPRGPRTMVMVYMKAEGNPSTSNTTSSSTSNSSYAAASSSTTPSDNNPTLSNPVQPPSRQEDQPSTTQTVELSPTLTSSNKRLAPLVNDLMNTDNMKAAVNILEARKRSGTLSECVSYPKADHPERMYVLIFDGEHAPPLAVLSPEKANGMRDNITNNKEESISLYKGMFAICFMMK